MAVRGSGPRAAAPGSAGLGGGLAFSLVWRFAQGAGALSGLSLAVGVALARGLNALGGPRVGLKWPNDIVAGGGKLGGILIELAGDMLGPSTAVIGTGINVRLSRGVRAAIDQPAVDIESMLDAPVDRNALLAGLLVELDRALAVFAVDGFGPFRSEWESLHAHQGKAVTLTAARWPQRARRSARGSGGRRAGARDGCAGRGAFTPVRSACGPRNSDEFDERMRVLASRRRQHPHQVGCARRRGLAGAGLDRDARAGSIGSRWAKLARPETAVACNVAGEAVRRSLAAAARRLALPLEFIASRAAAMRGGELVRPAGAARPRPLGCADRRAGICSTAPAWS